MTDKPHTVAYVPMERECDMCPRKAYADARIPGGGWAYVCKPHFQAYGCTLGLGNGQRLVVGVPPVREERSDDDIMRATVADALGISEDEVDL